MSPQLCAPQGPHGVAVSPTPPEGLPPGVRAEHTNFHNFIPSDTETDGSNLGATGQHQSRAECCRLRLLTLGLTDPLHLLRMCFSRRWRKDPFCVICYNKPVSVVPIIIPIISFSVRVIFQIHYLSPCIPQQVVHSLLPEVPADLFRFERHRDWSMSVCDWM